MFRKILILLVIVCNINIAWAKKLNIVTSVTPLAAITAMITGDTAQINVLAGPSQCPHHYFLKPEQFTQIKAADLIIYIDNNFEVFINKSLKITTANVLKLSNSSNLMTKVNSIDNWHLWYSLNNIKVMMQSIVEKLSQINPDLHSLYTKNYHHALEELSNIQNHMITRLTSETKYILLDPSLYYLFRNFKNDNQLEILSISSDTATFHTLEQITKHSLKTRNKCLFISSHQNKNKIQKRVGKKVKVISIDTEDWIMDENPPLTLSKRMYEAIDLIEQCL